MHYYDFIVMNNAAEGKYLTGVMGLKDFDIRVLSVREHLEEGLKHIPDYFKGKGNIPVTKTDMLANIKILEALDSSLAEHKVIVLEKCSNLLDRYMIIL